MAKRISWKKGMRLTDEILKASDNSYAALTELAFALAAAGRFGLFPTSRPFKVELNINHGIVDVVALDCLAITKGGQLIDASYDTRFTNVFETRVRIPDNEDVKEYYLSVNVTEEWKDTNDGYEEPVYSFSLLLPDSPVPDDALPIARIVDVEGFGWHIDEPNNLDGDNRGFVPPCLYVSSHSAYGELLRRFAEVLSGFDQKARGLLQSGGKDVIRVFWPIVQQLMIAIDKERDQLTPMVLLARVQQCVSAFTCACDLDESLKLAEAEAFRAYVAAPYNYKDVLARIEEGLGLCFTINEKLTKLAEIQPPIPEIQPTTSPRQRQQVAPEAPYIADKDIRQVCNTPTTEIPIIYHSNPTTTIFFTTDGSEPSIKSVRASKKQNGFIAKFDNGYRQKNGDEADKTIIIKLIAVVNGVRSQVSSYSIALQKAIHFKEVPEV